MAKEVKSGAKSTGGNAAQGMKCDVRFGSFPQEGSVRGVCSVTFNDQIAVKGVKVIEGSKGLFVAMPSYKSGDEYKDLAYPVTKEGRQMLNESVLAAYEAQRQAAEQDAGTEAMQEAPEGVPMSSIR